MHRIDVSRRGWLLVPIALTALLIGGCGRVAAATRGQASDQLSPRTLSVDGHERSYLLHVPRSYKEGTAIPLVLVLHGLGGSGAIVARQSDFAAQADAGGFIVAFPD